MSAPTMTTSNVAMARRPQDTAVGLPIGIVLVLLAFLTLGALSVDTAPAGNAATAATAAPR